MFNKEYIKKVIDEEVDDAGSSAMKALLWMAAFLFWCVVMVRHGLYALKILKAHKFEPKVISVGNLTVGGVGKTPLVEYLAESLNKQSKKVVVLMRGYMTQSDVKSDEAEVLRNNLGQIKILTGKNRIQMAQEYLKEHQADVIILDDGFQHLKIQRDLDVLMIDSTNPWGNGYLLPRGILRERWPAIKRAHIVILSKTDLAEQNIQVIRKKIKETNPDCLIVESIHQPVHLTDVETKDQCELSFLQGKIICALSAIGSPDSFEDLLRKQGAVIEESYRFLDHHSFSRNDILSVLHFCKAHQIDTVVTTQKDAVKLGAIFKELKPDIKFMYLSIQFTITKNEKDFRGRIDSLFSN